MPKQSPLADKEFAREFAEFIASINYTNQQQACDKFGIDRKTVGRWAKDARVTIILRELKAEREEKLSRRIDGELLRRIDDPATLRELDVKTLLDIRKQVLGPGTGKEDDDSANDADINAFLEDNPHIARDLAEAFNPRTKKLPKKNDNADA